MSRGLLHPQGNMDFRIGIFVESRASQDSVFLSVLPKSPGPSPWPHSPYLGKTLQTKMPELVNPSLMLMIPTPSKIADFWKDPCA